MPVCQPDFFIGDTRWPTLKTGVGIGAGTADGVGSAKGTGVTGAATGTRF